MKKLLLFIAAISSVEICSSQSIYDDFDDYKVGQYLGIESGGLWTTWTNNPGGSEDTYIVDNQSFSPDNSIQLMSGGVTDVVLPLGDHSSGSWTLSFMMRLTEGNGGYFNILHDFSAAASNWALQVYFSQTGYGNLVVGNGFVTAEFTHPVGEWFQVQVDVDIDSNQATMSISDASVFTWAWSEGSTSPSSILSALNLYPAAPLGETALYHVDNVSFSAFGVGIDELNSDISIYPNPANDVFYISNPQGSVVEVFNLLGESVYSSQLTGGQSSIDCSSWAKGVYFIELTSESNSTSKRKIILN